jgi:hypothetical protein
MLLPIEDVLPLVITGGADVDARISVFKPGNVFVGQHSQSYVEVFHGLDSSWW